MSADKLKTAWMWLDEAEVRGVTIDLETATMRWYDEIGCHCTDEEYTDQTVAAYKRTGAPPFIGRLPDDIQVEIKDTLANIQLD